MNARELEYVGREFVNFNDRTYRWVDVKHFELPGEVASPERALELLLDHVHYRDHYTSSESQTHDGADLHGPYALQAITVASFEAIDEDAAVGVISAFAGQYGGTTDDVITQLDQVAYPAIRDLRVRFRLRDLGKDAYHEFGWVLLEFLELVLIDLPARRLALLVAGVD